MIILKTLISQIKVVTLVLKFGFVFEQLRILKGRYFRRGKGNVLR